MTQTATRTSSARPAAVASPPAPLEVNLGRAAQHVINQAANARQARLAAEHVEDPLKEKRMEMIVAAMGGELPEGQKIIVKVLNVVRGTISWRPKKSVDLDLLMTAYPEAYTACVTTGSYPQYDPA